MRETLKNLYLSWINDFLSIDAFAEHHGLTVTEAGFLLTVAKSCFEKPHPEA